MAKEKAMNEDKFNMSLRKFLKQVGVTSQREIGPALVAVRRCRPPRPVSGKLSRLSFSPPQLLTPQLLTPSAFSSIVSVFPAAGPRPMSTLCV